MEGQKKGRKENRKEGNRKKIGKKETHVSVK